MVRCGHLNRCLSHPDYLCCCSAQQTLDTHSTNQSRELSMDDQQQQLQQLGWDWDLLSDDGDEGFLEGGKQQQHLYSSSRMMMPMLLYTMDYFICPHPPDLSKPATTTTTIVGEEKKKEESMGKLMKCQEYCDPVSQVSFKNIRETTDQFVEIKVDSSVKITPPAVKIEGAADFQEKLGMVVDSDDGSGGGGFNLWKWGLSGIGAICSFGVATLCIAIFTSQGQPKNHHHFHPHLNYKNQNDQRITTAHITFGGYYNSTL